MNIVYLGHSGFLAETSSCYYLFDYYRGALPPLEHDKSVIIFASHAHKDHYNPQVFPLLEEQGAGPLTAVLGKDISPRSYPPRTPCIKAMAHQTYTLPGQTTVQTLLSTDAGVAFLLRCPEGILYHAGDLNDWVWEEESEQYNRQMTGSYRHEIDSLQSMLGDNVVDAAFLPLDPRQGHASSRGILYFLQKIKVRQVWPMHYWEQPDIIPAFLREHPEYAELVINTEAFGIKGQNN